MNVLAIASFSRCVLARVTKTLTGDPSPCLLPYITLTHPSVPSLAGTFSPVSTSLCSYAPVTYPLSFHPSPIYTLCCYSSFRGGFKHRQAATRSLIFRLILVCMLCCKG